MSPVLFVGAGPGAVDLLTVRAKAAIEAADVVFFDQLVSDAIRALARDARPYTSIDQVIAEAKAGNNVVRLQIGDPTIFGRLAAQMHALDAAGLPYEIVPGVTAATAAAAAAKVSLTETTVGRSVALVSAHSPDIPVPDADTIVYYMGRPAGDEPVIAVENASLPSERVTRDPSAIGSPSIVISGLVTDLKSLPLRGVRVVVTRAESSTMNERLRRLGATVIAYPVIEIVAPSDPRAIDEAAAQASRYDWVIFTSVNGVRAFFDRIRDLRGFRARICAIGPATRAAVEAHKLVVDLTPPEYVAESLVSCFDQNLTGQRILLPRAAVARDVVPDELRRRGAIVDVVEAYRTVVPAGAVALAGDYDWVTFTSSSTVKNFLALGNRPRGRVASIGPVTSATLRMHSIEPDVEAGEFTTAGLVEAIVCANRR